MKGQFELESLLPEPKKCFERSNFFQMPYRVFCNLADTLVRFRTNQEVMMFTDKKNYTRVAFQLLAFRRKPKKLRLFYRNKKLTA